MKSKVYIETTIVSYLVASPSRDVIQSAHQQVTREWWARRSRFDLFVSRPVLAEAGRCHSCGPAVGKVDRYSHAVDWSGDWSPREHAAAHGCATSEGTNRCRSCGDRRHKRHGLPLDLESPAFGQRGHPWEDRRCVPEGWSTFASHLYA